MSVTQPIIDRILADARAEAEKIVAQAKTLNEASVQAVEEETSTMIAQSKARALRDAEDVIRRRRTVAALEMKKISLASKRHILNLTFEEALRQLCALPVAEYGELVKSLIEQYSEYNDEIVMSKTSPVERSFLMAIPVYDYKKLKLSSKQGDFAGGLVLVGSTYDKRLTFETLLSQARAEMETEVSIALGE